MITLRQLFKVTAMSFRALSNQVRTIELVVDKEGIATLSLKRPPVNSLNVEVLNEMNEVLDFVANNKYKGMIWTSATAGVFSTGGDISDFYRPNCQRTLDYFSALHEVWLKIFGSSFVTAAAINGHVLGSSCLLALACEYRVMMFGKSTIGFVEPALGIVLPPYFVDTLRNVVHTKHAERALSSAKLFSVEEALKIELIDETAMHKDEAIEKCKNFINSHDRIPSNARVATKLKLREAPLNWLKQNRMEDLENSWREMSNFKVQSQIEKYLKINKT